MTFPTNSIVAWATRDNTFTGRILESNDLTSVVMVNNSAKRSVLVGKKLIIRNDDLGDFSNGRTEVLESKGVIYG